MTARNIFISYSRKNGEFVDHIIRDLNNAGFDLWRDSENLIPGTPSWERAIREAIKHAEAVVLVASPDSLNSDYVQGELALAQNYHRPIYPVWADGEQWIESAPLNMVNYQYVDMRNEHYNHGLDDLSSTLNKLFDRSEGTIKLGLPTHETVELNLAQFDSAFNILSHIWMNHLYGWYEILSYGKEWVLGNVKTKQLALPWEWLKVDLTDSLALMKFYTVTEKISYVDFGIVSGSYWAIWDARRLKATGLFLNDDNLKKALLSENLYSELKMHLNMQKLEHKPLEEVTSDKYKHRVVVATMDFNDKRSAIIEV